MDATFWAPFLRITSVILGIITACSVTGAYYFERESRGSIVRRPRKRHCIGRQG